MAGAARVGRGASIIVGGLTLGAWVAVFAGHDADGAGIVGFVAAWTVMMVVMMMLPSAAPFVRLYRRGGDAGGDDPHRSPKRPITLRTFGREGAPNAGRGSRSTSAWPCCSPRAHPTQGRP